MLSSGYNVAAAIMHTKQLWLRVQDGALSILSWISEGLRGYPLPQQPISTYLLPVEGGVVFFSGVATGKLSRL